MNGMSVKAAIAAIRQAATIIELNAVEVCDLEDESSGRIHIGFRREIDREYATFEACNADIAGKRRRITLDAANAKPEKLRCLRCYPRRHVPEPISVTEAAEERY